MSDRAELNGADDSSSNQSLEGYDHKFNALFGKLFFCQKGIASLKLGELFTYGFCAYKNIAKLETKLNNVKQTVPKQNDFSYTEIFQNIKKQKSRTRAESSKCGNQWNQMITMRALLTTY